MSFSDLTVAILLAFLPLTGVLFGLYTSYVKWHDSPFRQTSLPPGPPPIRLLLGKERDASSQAWLKYAEWAKKYGDIIHFKLYGQCIIVLNSIDDAVEMFEKRSNVYSDRPSSTMSDLMGWDFNTAMMPYGPEWRAHRKLYQQCFRSKVSLAYIPIQTEKTRVMLQALLDTPNNFRIHCKIATTAILMSLLYGHDLTPETTEYFACMVDEATTKLVDTLVPGTNAVNWMPFLQYLPTWFPGAEFKRSALEVRKMTQQMVEAPIDFVGKGLLEGTSGPSLVSDLLEDCYVQREYERIKTVAATTYSAGAYTMTSSLLTFFLAMSKFPEAQKKAQTEIDKIVGSDRLPTYADRASLPYVEALYREVLRWKPPQPLNTAHATTEADIYGGYEIPKGATIIANIWAMTRNKEQYPDPESFLPERFFDEGGNLNNDGVDFVFGFGRRICPGRHLASATVWLMIVSVLATFNIGRKRDAKGNEIDLDPKYSNGLVAHPLRFECSITPRRSSTAKLIGGAIAVKS